MKRDYIKPETTVMNTEDLFLLCASNVDTLNTNGGMLNVGGGADPARSSFHNGFGNWGGFGN